MCLINKKIILIFAGVHKLREKKSHCFEISYSANSFQTIIKNRDKIFLNYDFLHSSCFKRLKARVYEYLCEADLMRKYTARVKSFPSPKFIITEKILKFTKDFG